MVQFKSVWFIAYNLYFNKPYFEKSLQFYDVGGETIYYSIIITNTKFDALHYENYWEQLNLY